MPDIRKTSPRHFRGVVQLARVKAKRVVTVYRIPRLVIRPGETAIFKRIGR
jgi:hypothetical protein